MKLTKAIVVSTAILLAPAGGLLAEEEEEGWKSSLALGFNLTDGNSETTTFNADINAENKWDNNELMLGGRYAKGEVDGSTTTDNGGVFGQYNRLFSERLYGYISSSLSFDDVADVDYRFLLGPGIGYYVIKNDAAQMGLEAGATYIKDEVGGVEDDAVALRLAERYDRALSETDKVWQSIEYLPEFDDFDMYLLNFEIGVEAALGSRMNLRVSALDRFDSDPAPGREDNDISINVALVYTIK